MSQEARRGSTMEPVQVELVSIKFEASLPDNSPREAVLLKCCERIQEVTGQSVSAQDVQLFKLSRVRSSEKTLKGRIAFSQRPSASLENASLPSFSSFSSFSSLPSSSSSSLNSTDHSSESDQMRRLQEQNDNLEERLTRSVTALMAFQKQHASIHNSYNAMKQQIDELTNRCLDLEAQLLFARSHSSAPSSPHSAPVVSPTPHSPSRLSPQTPSVPEVKENGAALVVPVVQVNNPSSPASPSVSFVLDLEPFPSPSSDSRSSSSSDSSSPSTSSSSSSSTSLSLPLGNKSPNRVSPRTSDPNPIEDTARFTLRRTSLEPADGGSLQRASTVSLDPPRDHHASSSSSDSSSSSSSENSQKASIAQEIAALRLVSPRQAPVSPDQSADPSVCKCAQFVPQDTANWICKMCEQTIIKHPQHASSSSFELVERRKSRN